MQNASRGIVSLLILPAVAVLYGCEAPPDSSRTAGQPTMAATAGNSVSAAATTPQQQQQQQHTRQTQQPPAPIIVPAGGDSPVGTLVDARPAALVNGRPVTWGDLRPALNELAGAEALYELALDRRIAEELAAANITISPDDVAAERKALLESLSDDPNIAIRLLDELRDRQNLGRTRFEALLRRNAGLRALVRDQVRITEDALRTMHELIYGPKRQARIMVLPDLAAAQAAINLVNTGVSFADAAVELSIDSSAPRGGLLEPISQADPAYPEALRQTLWSLNPGEISGPVLIDNRYAVVMLVKRIAGENVSLDDVRPAMERLVRINQERLLMDQLARRLMSETTVTVFDDSLHDAWRKRRLRQ